MGLSFLLCLIACRVTGETDATPVGALGQVTQLIFGALLPRDVEANIVTAGITVNAASSAADLLSDLKTGHLLGAHPRRQFLAQLVGTAVGAAAVVPLFYLLVPDRAALGGSCFRRPPPSPPRASPRCSPRAWRGYLASIRTAGAWAAIVAAVLTLAEHVLPRAVPALGALARWGLGLACLLPASTALASSWGAGDGGGARVRPAAVEGRVLPLARVSSRARGLWASPSRRCAVW